MGKRRQIITVLVVFLLLMGSILYKPQNIFGDAGTLAANTLANKLQGVIALYIDSPLALVNNEEVKLDPANDFITPILLAGRALVPVRFIAESLGWDVTWEADKNLVILSTEQQEIRLILGEKEFWFNGEKVGLDAPAIRHLDRTYIPLRAVSEAFGKDVYYEDGLLVIADKDQKIALAEDITIWAQVREKLNTLPVVGTAENLKKLLAEASSSGNYIRGMDQTELVMKQAADSTDNTSPAESAASAYSETNLQVQGVDEADYIKTDGKYFYQVSGTKVIISQAYPAESLKVQAVLNYDDNVFSPRELYVDQSYLVVIGTSSDNRIYPLDAQVPTKMIRPPYFSNTKTTALIYDITDKSNISKIRELDVDGNYVSSRKIGSALYLVSNQYIDTYRILEKEPILLPTYRDTALQAGDVEIPLAEVRCILPIIQPNYLIVTGLDLTQPEKAAQVKAYLGAGENVYVSEKNLYVAVTEYSNRYIVRDDFILDSTDKSNTEKTLIYKFGLNQGQVIYLQKGQVPGRVLNQFSMDEYQEYFRIATTIGYSWSNDNSSSNNLYVLDSSLRIRGRIEDIAPGEQIYSARFMGERAYLVTFKNVDPLFVIDLKDPHNPNILGALKIPGYSDYLHPYGDNYLIGFGNDTVEVPFKDYQGRVKGTTAYYLGMKVALFDITDVTKPKELFTEVIGDRGTSSELLYNHKALLFNPESGLLAFPVSLYELPAGGETIQAHNIPAYGQFTFQGAYVYNLNLTDGFTLRGRISHLTAEDYQKAGYSRARSDKEVKRILFIGNTLYTLSDTQIRANDLQTLENINSLALP